MTKLRQQQPMQTDGGLNSLEMGNFVDDVDVDKVVIVWLAWSVAAAVETVKVKPEELNCVHFA